MVQHLARPVAAVAPPRKRRRAEGATEGGEIGGAEGVFPFLARMKRKRRDGGEGAICRGSEGGAKFRAPCQRFNPEKVNTPLFKSRRLGFEGDEGGGRGEKAALRDGGSKRPD